MLGHKPPTAERQAVIVRVHLLYGSTDGLASTGSQFWNQNSTGIFGSMEPYDWFGLVLTTETSENRPVLGKEMAARDYPVSTLLYSRN